MACTHVCVRLADRSPRSLQGPPIGCSGSRGAGAASLMSHLSTRSGGRLLIGNQGGFPRAVGEEEVAGTVDQLSGAVDLLTRAATGARRRAAESL
jgi:hypothetical protein